ncbi:hypothetical protein HPB50_013924 [Hyalomma asiaticum]|uniref:Uncharacterized protein n=1 Tax=Hyalomma asiaticum TaxID=266040 RepID=A0ACB7SF87_HYAAI|nr:hypothetical protein HPB50_013924 [Hyalomma asiaticum]
MPCVNCKYLRKALHTRQSRLRRCQRTPKRPCLMASRDLKVSKLKNKRLEARLSTLSQKLKKAKKECGAIAEEMLAEKIKSLSPKQQLAVRQCFEASKRKSAHGMLYDKEWLLECILLRTRGPKLYQHMRQQQILALPSESTLRKYTAQYRRSYGFNEKVLGALKKKVGQMDQFKRRGGIVIDEMKLSEHLSVTTGAKIEGFVDLGPYTPEEQKTLPCNHGLVVMFVPLVGKWTQVLGAFASNENVKGELLAKIVLEATILAEKAGLFVDYVTCDVASWNRKMWRVYNIRASLKEVVCKKTHPVNSNRQDKVESFFGIVRLSSGCNTHPTPQQFLLTVNCLPYYNLASSVVGSNVDKDLITSLLSTGELEEETQKEGFFSVCKAHVEAELPSTSTSPREVEDHWYHVQRSDSRLIYYVRGCATSTGPQFFSAREPSRRHLEIEIITSWHEQHELCTEPYRAQPI